MGDQCKNRELRVLLVEGDDVEDEEAFKNSMVDQPLKVIDKVELSLSSVVGLIIPSTMKLRGTVGSSIVTVLINCGATHNFISLEVVQKLRIPMAATTNYGVVMGTGESVKGRGICKGVVLELHGLTIVEDLLSLELGSTHVLLRCNGWEVWAAWRLIGSSSP